MSVPRDDFRSAMARLGAAVNVVTTDGRAGRRGLTASAVCSVTDAPPTVLVCVRRASRTHPVIEANGVFCVNVLAASHAALADRFATSGKDAEIGFSTTGSWTTLRSGSPVLTDASVAVDCEVIGSHRCGSHDVFFGRVLEVRLNASAQGLIYFQRTYVPLGVNN